MVISGRLIVHAPVTELGRREPLEDGQLTDTATMLIDRNMESTKVHVGEEQRTPLLWLTATWRNSVTPPPKADDGAADAAKAAAASTGAFPYNP